MEVNSSSPAFTLVSDKVGLKDAATALCPVLDKRFGKVTLKVGIEEEEIIANPQFLAFKSPFFNNLIKNDNQSEPILLPGLEYGAVYPIVSYLYTGYLEIRESNVCSLLMAASRFEIAEVQTTCLDYLNSLKLNLENYWKIRELAKEQGLQDLLDKCDEFLFKNLSQVLESRTYATLEFSEVKVFLGVIKARLRPEVRSMEALNAVTKWGFHNIEDRKPYLFSLVSQINLMEILETHSALVLKEAFMGKASPLKNCWSCKILYFEVCEAKLLESSQLSSNPKDRAETMIVPNPVTSHPSNQVTSTIEDMDDFEKDTTKDEYVSPFLPAYNRMTNTGDLVRKNGENSGSRDLENQSETSTTASPPPKRAFFKDVQEYREANRREQERRGRDYNRYKCGFHLKSRLGTASTFLKHGKGMHYPTSYKCSHEECKDNPYWSS